MGAMDYGGVQQSTERHMHWTECGKDTRSAQQCPSMASHQVPQALEDGDQRWPWQSADPVDEGQCASHRKTRAAKMGRLY